MSGRHSPRWVTRKARGYDIDIVTVDTVDRPSAGRIARVSGGSGGRPVRQTAALIAAAPELLARLKARVKECPCCGDPGFPTELMCDECRADLKVIANAELRA